MSNSFYNKFDTENLTGSRPDDDDRTPFQVDRDRIIFSYAFRRLQSKTQVFQAGEYDFYRTRLTHTIEVARIGRAISDWLNRNSGFLNKDFFIDPDLVEAVCLAHDLGHPPFGHNGERKLNALMWRYGGFEGNAQTLRIITDLFYERPDNPMGMSPTRAFLDGVLKYKNLYSEKIDLSNLKQPIYPTNHFIYDEQKDFRQFAFGEIDLNKLLDSDLNLILKIKSIECEIMDWADDIAYSLHDILDGVKAGVITVEKIKKWKAQNIDSDFQTEILKSLIKSIDDGYIEPKFSNKIGAFIKACKVKDRENQMANYTNRYKFCLSIDPNMLAESSIYKKLANDLVFQSPPIQQIEFKGGHILEKLFSVFSNNYLMGENNNNMSSSLKIIQNPMARWIEEASSKNQKARLICDHLSGMTDGIAIRAYRRLFDPELGYLSDLQ